MSPFDAFTPEPWTSEAICATHPQPDLWFAGEGELRGGTVRQASASTRHAQTICQTCPVRTECLNHAITNKETFGVWGGLTGPERQKLAKAAA